MFVFKEKIWGGIVLWDIFGYGIFLEIIGECWVILVYLKGLSIIMNGLYKGKILIELWDEYWEVFGCVEGEWFLFLIKLLDVKEDMLIKVYFDDYYVGENEEGEFGKMECWYIIDCKENVEIIYGYIVCLKIEFVIMINSGDWEGLLWRIKIKLGDFYYVFSGMLYVLCKGVFVLEI